MKLVPMVDYVLEQLDLLYNAKISQNQYVSRTKKYAIFLKQPLELWMFVPCDDEGNVLDYEMIYATKEKDYIFESKPFDEYQQAKERCLFEGFELNGKYLWLNNSLFMISDNHNDSFKNYGLIENLQRRYLSNDIELTPTAIKQLQS